MFTTSTLASQAGFPEETKRQYLSVPGLQRTGCSLPVFLAPVPDYYMSMTLQLRMRRLTELHQRLNNASTGSIGNLKNKLNLAERALQSVNPLATLQRGYAIVSDSATGNVLTNISMAKPGSKITARLAHGALIATVDKVKKEITSDD